MKNVLYIRSGPYKPDISNYNMQEIGFAKALMKHDISTDIVYYSDITREEIVQQNETARIRILWEKGYKILRSGYYPRIVSKDLLASYDLVILTEYSQIMTVLISRICDRCVLYNGTYVNLFKLPFLEPVYDTLFAKKMNQRIQKIYVKSELSKAYLEKKGYSNVTTLGVGLDTDRFTSVQEPSQDTLRIMEYMDQHRCLLYVGTLCDWKNFPFLLEIFERLKGRYHSSFHLLLIGRGNEAYVKKYLDRLDPSIRSDIMHVERVANDQLRYIYERSSIFLLPSKLEIFGMVLLEAMYFSNCVLTSINGGSTTLIRDGENGFVFSKFYSDEWADMIHRLEADDAYLDRICTCAHVTIQEGYRWDRILAKFAKDLPESFDMKIEVEHA